MTRRTVSVPAEIDHPVDWPTAPCTADPDLFFTSTDVAAVHEAQRICAGCPLLARCARFAQARPHRVTDGVFASVLMPREGAVASQKHKALDRLQTVAATGKPAPLHDFHRFEGTEQELRMEVARLRDEEMSWSEIARTVGVSVFRAQRAYMAGLPGEAVA